MKFSVQEFLLLLFIANCSNHIWCISIDEENNEVSFQSHDVSGVQINPDSLQPAKIKYEDSRAPDMLLTRAGPTPAPSSVELGLLKELTNKIRSGSRIDVNETNGRSISLNEAERGGLPSPKPILFTIGSSDTGLHWDQIPYREKFQWHNHDAPCHPFKLTVPHEQKNKSVIDLCIYRDHLVFKEESLIIMHTAESINDEEKEMRVVGQVNKAGVSTVSGKIVDTFFYGEISMQDPGSKESIVYVIEELKFLSQLIHHNDKVMHTLLSVMNSGQSYSSTTVKYNAVVTQGTSIVNFIGNENAEEMISRPILIFSTGHNSYLSPGDAVMDVEDSGRITFSSTGNTISIDVDGSVQLKLANKEYTFRPNGRTIVKEGMNVRTLQEHEGSVALTAFTSSMTYSCMLPTPAFNMRKQGGYLCKVCLAIDASYEKHFNQHHKYLISSSTYLGHVIDKVSWIFRATDWNDDGVTDNIGLDWDTQSFEWNYTGDKSDESLSDAELEVLFKSLAEIDFSECCLGIAYTMKKFPDSVFAKSSASKATPTGGVCSTHIEGSVSTNIILISANDKMGNELNEDKLTYITAHEIAKTFGASDDITGQLECDQFKHDDQNIGHFILWPDVMRDVSAAEKTFSPCSRKIITDTLSSCKSACFEVNKHPFCGNGIVEDSEECDCGDEYSCSKQKCCYSRNDKQPCRKTGIKCQKTSSAVGISQNIGIVGIAQVLTCLMHLY